MRIAAGSSDTLAGRTITVTGFTFKEGARTDLAKIVIVCCAADAQLARLQMSGPAAASVSALPREHLGVGDGNRADRAELSRSFFDPRHRGHRGNPHRSAQEHLLRESRCATRHTCSTCRAHCSTSSNRYRRRSPSTPRCRRRRVHAGLACGLLRAGLESDSVRRPLDARAGPLRGRFR